MNKTSNLGLPLDTAGHIGLQQSFEKAMGILDEKVQQALDGESGAPTEIDAADVTVAADETNGVEAGDLQTVISALAARIKALEPTG
jgi:hypothetical protein